MSPALRRPLWLASLTDLHGEPDKDPHADRWLWDEGEYGVIISHRTHVWEVLAFGTARSVTIRSITAPTDVDISQAVALAGLYDRPGAVAT